MKKINLFFGPPLDRAKDDAWMARFFAQDGAYVLVGGTTSSLAARYLGTEIKTSLLSPDEAIPPCYEVQGTALSTEGIHTMRAALRMLSDGTWRGRTDGAARLCEVLSEAESLSLFVGRAENPADPTLAQEKIRLALSLSAFLTARGAETELVLC